MAQGVDQRVERVLTYGWLELAFPHGDAVPLHPPKLEQYFLVALTVTTDFLLPEVRVRLGYDEVTATFMPVPEASVHEDYRAVARQHEVRTSGQACIVEPVAKATAEEEMPYKHLRSGVASAYGSHAPVPLFLGHFVHADAKLLIVGR